MNRRAFLQLLGAGAAGLVLDPELALWKPGAKTIFLPPKPLLVAPVGLMRGDVFTIEGVFATNPVSYAHTHFLKQFVITNDIRAGESVMAAMHPPIIPDGVFKNASQMPFANAVIKPLSWADIFNDRQAVA